MVYKYLSGIVVIIVSLNLLFSCNNKLSIETKQYATIGHKIYQSKCANCHGNNGEGLGKLYPPLTDTTFLNENRNKLACFIKNGLQGEIKVNNQTFNQAMPAMPELTNIDIAYVLTYVTTTFGNSETHYTLEEIESFLKDCQ